MTTWTVGSIEVTRVDDPGFELILAQEAETVTALQRAPWLQPHFVTDDWSLVIGSSATVIRTPAAAVLVDPFLAFGDGKDIGTVDLRDVTFMDSSGLNALITAHRLAEQHGSQISVCDLPPHVLKLFEVTGVDELLNVIPG